MQNGLPVSTVPLVVILFKISRTCLNNCINLTFGSHAKMVMSKEKKQGTKKRSRKKEGVEGVGLKCRDDGLKVLKT